MSQVMEMTFVILEDGNTRSSRETMQKRGQCVYFGCCLVFVTLRVPCLKV